MGLLAFLVFSNFVWPSDQCPFSKLSPARLANIEQLLRASSPSKQLELFDAASPREQSDIVDIFASQRLANWGTFTETVSLQQMHQLALRPAAHREATRQTLQHLVQVFHSGADPTIFDDFKIDHTLTESGFTTGQSNMEFSRKVAIDYACDLASKGLGGEYEYAILINGLNEALVGSKNRPPGRGMEFDAVAEGAKILLAPDSKFPDHLRPAVQRLLSVKPINQP